MTLRARWPLLPLVLATMLMPFGSTSLTVAVPTIAVHFHARPEALAHALVTAYLVAGVALQGVGGALGDRFGHARVLRYGQWGYAVASCVAALAPSLGVLVAARFGVGVAGASMLPSALAMARAAVPPERFGRALGVMSMTATSSAAAGPLVAGELLRLAGWRVTFLVLVPPALLGLALLREPRAAAPATPPSEGSASASGVPRDAGFSLLDALLTACATVALSLALRYRSVALLAATAALTAGMLAHGRRVARPILDPALLRTPGVRSGGAVVALHNLVFYALLFAVPVWLEGGALRLAPGRALLVLLLAQLVGAPAGARLAERVGGALALVTSTLLALASMGLLWRALAAPTAAALLSALALFGLATGLAASPAQVSALGHVTQGRSGAGASVLSVLRYLGGLVGVSLLASGGATGAGALRGRFAFLVAALVVGGVAGALVPRAPRRGDEAAVA